MARYIDADKCLDAMLDEMVGTGYQSRAMGVIKYAPTADVVEVKHGEWVRVADSYGKEYLCSACKGGIRKYIGQPYCSSCGAKMDGQTPQKINHNSLCETETYKVDK